MREPIEFRKVRDFGDIVNDTFVFMGQNWKPLLKAFAVICGFFVVASLAAAILQQTKMVQFFNDGPRNIAANYESSSSSQFLKYFTWNALVSAVLQVFTYTSISLTTLAYIALYVEKGNQAPSVEEVWAYFKFYFWRVLGTHVLLVLCLFIGCIPCFAGFIYLWPPLSLIVPVMVVENSTLGYAFGRAFDLIKGNFWMVLGILIVTAIIWYVALAVFVLPISAFSLGSILTGGHKFNYTYIILTTIASHLGLVLYIIHPIVRAFCYYSIAEEKDGTGLMGRIEKLGQPENEAGQFPTEEY